MTADSGLLLGVDFGTGGCKITAIRPDGVPAGEASVEYATHHEQPSWSEQDPADWFQAFRAALEKLRGRGTDTKTVRAIAFDGSTHNAVLLDAEYRPLRRTILWTDQRSTEECAFLREQYGREIFETAYQSPAPTWTLPQLLWLRRHEPEIMNRTKHILFIKDYVRFLVTGRACTDRIEAQGTLFFGMRNGKWSDALFALTGMAKSVLPEIVEPETVTGRLTEDAAAATGLPAGIPVVCGTSDSAAEDYGAGAIEAGDGIVKLATAGNVNIMTSEAHPSERTLTYAHVVRPLFYTVSATNAAALCLRWFRDTFRADGAPDGHVFEEMDLLAAHSRPGAGGMFFHPYLQGERSPYWDASLRASFTGVSISSTRGDFVRALLEGVAFSLRDCYSLIEQMDLEVKRIFLIGGGARSPLWSSIVCDVFNLPLSVPYPGDASFGTALLAGVGAGFFRTPKEAAAQCRLPARELTPDPGNADLYCELFLRYKAFHDALAPVYQAQISNTQGEKIK